MWRRIQTMKKRNEIGNNIERMNERARTRKEMKMSTVTHKNAFSIVCTLRRSIRCWHHCRCIFNLWPSFIICIVSGFLHQLNVWVTIYRSRSVAFIRKFEKWLCRPLDLESCSRMRSTFFYLSLFLRFVFVVGQRRLFWMINNWAFWRRNCDFSYD